MCRVGMCSACGMRHAGVTASLLRMHIDSGDSLPRSIRPHPAILPNSSVLATRACSKTRAPMQIRTCGRRKCLAKSRHADNASAWQNPRMRSNSKQIQSMRERYQYTVAFTRWHMVRPHASRPASYLPSVISHTSRVLARTSRLLARAGLLIMTSGDSRSGCPAVSKRTWARLFSDHLTVAQGQASG